MDRRLNGINPLSYRGVNALTPPNLVRVPKAPTAQDLCAGALGTIWVDTSVNPPSGLAIYMLMSVAESVATWVNFGGPSGTIRGIPDAGIPVVPDVNHDIFFDGGTLINTVGTLNTMTFNLDQGMDGQIPIAATGLDTAYANITSNDGTVTITNGANTIDLSASFTVDGLNELTPDTGGTVQPVTGNINIAGGELINTVGTAETITINLNRGDDGQIPIAATGGATQYANITSSNATLTITNTPNGIDIVNNGAGGSSITITTFDVSGTWTKGVGTLCVEVYGWNGGGGGGSGSRSSNAMGGAGGSWGTVGWYRLPGAFVGATAAVVIGAGGTGGASQTVNNSAGHPGGNSGVTSFGNLTFLPVNGINGASDGNSGGGGGSTSGTQIAGGYPQLWLMTTPPCLSVLSLADANRAGSGKATTGGNGNNAGRPLPPSSSQTSYSILSNFLQGTGGGGGGGGGSAADGGTGGNILTVDGLTTVLAGGAAGSGAGGNGSNGNAAATGTTAAGVMCGGTGGGGGASGASISNGGNGGTGGFPGGGGGGGGGTINGFNSGAGGNGGAGRIVVIEFA